MEITEGIININKPQDWTSHDCVAVMRRILGIKRIGHTGTLDPMATGVLPICIGSSTRIMEYLDLDFKTYRCSMQLGIETDTCDIWGQVTGERDISNEKTQGSRGQEFQERKEQDEIREADILRAFASFHGTIAQVPPRYAAVKVNGKKLYQYARAGEAVEIKPRNVYIKELTVDFIDLEAGTVTYTVTCSKGTYIRSICRDVGAALGCGAAMTALERVSSGRFSIADAVDLERLREMNREEISRHVVPTDFPLIHFGKAVVNKDRAEYFCNGGHIAMKDVKILRRPEYEDKEAHIPVKEAYKKAYNLYLQDSGREIFLGVACYHDKYKKLAADKVFHRG